MSMIMRKNQAEPGFAFCLTLLLKWGII